MSKYLIRASYTTEGVKGLLKDGGSKRVRAVEEALKPLGAKVESFYFALGEADVYLIVDAPDVETVSAVSMVTNASGARSFEHDSAHDSATSGRGGQEVRGLYAAGRIAG